MGQVYFLFPYLVVYEMCLKGNDVFGNHVHLFTSQFGYLSWFTYIIRHI